MEALGGEVHACRLTPKNLLSFNRRFARILENGRYDVVHSHYWLSGWVGKLLAERWDLPHTTTFHTLARVKNRALLGPSETERRAAFVPEWAHATAQLGIDESRPGIYRALYRAAAVLIVLLGLRTFLRGMAFNGWISPGRFW